MMFSFVSVVVSMYLGVVNIDVFTVFSLLHKLYPFCLCIVMVNYVSSALYHSPIHYFVLASIVLPPSTQATV